MGNALDAVLQYKAQQAAAQQAQANSLTTAFQLFNQARQQVQDNQFKALTLKAGLAEKGIKLNKDGSFSRDDNLQSPWDKLIEQGKAATAQKAIYDAGGPAPTMFGTPTVPGQSASGSSSTENIVPTEYDAFGRPKAFKNLDTVKQEEIAKGIPADKAGLADLANESINSIEEVKKILYPKGTPDSFDRGVAAASNLPGNSVPILGALIPQSVPDIGVNRDLAEKAQKVARLTSSAIAGRQLIQTGVAARPEETARLYSQFAANGFSAPDTGLQGLNQLQDFYKNYIEILQTKGLPEAKKFAEEHKSEIMDSQKAPLKDLINTGNKNLDSVLTDQISPAAQFINSALSIPFTDISPKSGLEALGFKLPASNNAIGKTRDLIAGGIGSFANVPLRGAAALAGMTGLAKLGMSTANSIKVMEETAPKAKGIISKAVDSITPANNADSLITAVRPKALAWADSEMKQYSDAMQSIKKVGGNVQTSDALTSLQKVISDLKIKAEDGTFLRKPTVAEKRILDAEQYLNKVSAKTGTGEIPSTTVVDAAKKIAGKFSKNGGSEQHLALNAAHELLSTLPTEAQGILKTANIKYGDFKTLFADSNKMFNFYGSANDTKTGLNAIEGLADNPGAKRTIADLENAIKYKFADRANFISDLNKAVVHYYNPFIALPSATRAAKSAINMSRNKLFGVAPKASSVLDKYKIQNANTIKILEDLNKKAKKGGK